MRGAPRRPRTCAVAVTPKRGNSATPSHGPVEEVTGSEPEPTPEQRRGTRPRNRSRTTALEVHVTGFVESLFTEFASRIKRRPQVFKRRVLDLIRQHLPPYPNHTGKPMSPLVTQACQLLEDQDRQMAAGARMKRDWLPIARACVPGFDGLRTIIARNRAIRRLQNAVSQRQARQRHANKRREKQSKQPSTVS